MKISYSAKGILWQGFAVGFAASSVAVLGVPPWLPVLIFGAGLAFGLGADLPSGLGRRFWPALLLPLGICALWGVALHLSGGDYSLEQADAWLPVRVLAYPGYFLGSFLLESSQWVWDFFPTALGVEISTWHYTG